MSLPQRAIFEVWPQLRDRIPWVALGHLPTPIEALTPVLAAGNLEGGRAWVKRDDLSHPAYGGNKVRTLEVLLGQALAQGATHIIATGAFGSNHALATAIHGKHQGLTVDATLFPQPPSRAALDNLRATLACADHLTALPHWSALPLGMAWTRWRHRRAGHRPYVMVPGGATPHGALGYVSAGLELASQIEAGAMPTPEAVLVGVGSTCTSAGLLVGMHLAARLGLGWTRPPRLVSVRVTPWPVTSPVRIANLARDASRHLAALADDPSLALPWKTLRRGLEVDADFLGRGYGHPTEAGREAIDLFARLPGLALDTTYSAKAAAALLARLRRGSHGPWLFWSTRSTAPLPAPDPRAEADAPWLVRRWLARARTTLTPTRP